MNATNPTHNPIPALEKLLDGPRDSALLRFGLGNEYLKIADPEHAIALYESALARDPTYSAAWKALGKTLAGTGQHDAARQAFQTGISVAEARGDVQAAKEMRVFLKRLAAPEPTP
jgi:Tfp pilus assembly protein PilF